MQRRRALTRRETLGTIGSSTLCGCLGPFNNTSTNVKKNEYEWQYQVGGKLDAVSHGTVFGQERPVFTTGSERNGEIFALDAATGQRRWTYGKTGVVANYRSKLTVADGVFFCRGDDQIGNGVGTTQALERDGTKRWTRDIGGYRRPFVRSNSVYIGSDDGTVRALDAATGSNRWTTTVRDNGSSEAYKIGIVGLSDSVYVDAGFLAALDPEDGTTRWTYGDEDARLDSIVEDETAYVSGAGWVAAVVGGTEQWRMSFQGTSLNALRGIASGQLLLERRTQKGTFQLSALDATTGEQDWVHRAIEHPALKSLEDVVGVYDGIVYLGTDQLRSFDVVTGTERWHIAIDGAIQSVTIADDGIEGDHAVFVHYNDGRLAGFDPSGGRLWEGSLGSTIQNYIISDYAFVATEEGVCSLDWQTNSEEPIK